jgi:hypothetical protein
MLRGRPQEGLPGCLREVVVVGMGSSNFGLPGHKGQRTLWPAASCGVSDFALTAVGRAECGGRQAQRQLWHRGMQPPSGVKPRRVRADHPASNVQGRRKREGDKDVEEVDQNICRIVTEPRERARWPRRCRCFS